MKKIGLVTFFWSNYGSALQCYATKHFLRENGYDVTLIRKVPFGEEADAIEENRKRHPEFWEDFQKFMKSLSENSSLMSEASLNLIDRFTEQVLCPEEFTYTQLEEAGRLDEYAAFIVGSDQVWNVTIGMVSPIFFLLFAPPKKRIALCPSFGLEQVPPYLTEDLRKVLNEYSRLSAREDAGVRIIRQITGRGAERLPDPTVFLTPAQWRSFAGMEDEQKKEGDYLLLHFLNKPNDLALKHISQLIRETGWKVKCFSTWYPEYEELKKVQLPDGSMCDLTFAEGGPEDYVRSIGNAGLVCTDSFHTTMFSMNLETSFYSYDRQYAHGVSQVSRLVTALTYYGLMDRLILSEDALENSGAQQLAFHIDEKRDLEREHIRRYLLEELQQKA